MFVSRVLFTTLKRTTGLVGVPVIPNARAVLIDLYDKTLENVKVGGYSTPRLIFRKSLQTQNTERM